MAVTRADLESRERQFFAPYAQFSGDTRGRVYDETPPEWRTHYQRDRDRVIHSRAFRRLEYKTQVFLSGSGDHYRTRLTHTMEVAGISRNIARALCINEDLAETIALAHDLGHSPFGHGGENVLDRLMKEHGGFEHNHHSLRIVEEIEQKYPAFPGLNLTWEVREGLLKHRNVKSPSLEAQVANLADEIAYYSHDLDDGLASGLLHEKKLSRDVRIWRDAEKFVRRTFGDLPEEPRRYYIIRCIIDDQVRDVVTTAEDLIQKARIHSADEVRGQSRPLIRYSPKRRQLNVELRKYLYQNLYYNPAVHQPNLEAGRMMEELFVYYREHPRKIGEQSRTRIRKNGLQRAICDYIAGMTDRYLIQEHERIFALKMSRFK